MLRSHGIGKSRDQNQDWTCTCGHKFQYYSKRYLKELTDGASTTIYKVAYSRHFRLMLRNYSDVILSRHIHAMDLLWKKFQWILLLYMKPISFQPKALVVCSVTAAIFIDFCLKTLNVFSQHICQKNKWISEFRRKNPQELKCWSTFCVNYFLRYYSMMQHQPIVKRVNGTHEWAHRPYQLLITAACTNTGGKIKDSHPRAADRCPFVPRHGYVRLPLSCGWECYVKIMTSGSAVWISIIDKLAGIHIIKSFKYFKGLNHISALPSKIQVVIWV